MRLVDGRGNSYVYVRIVSPSPNLKENQMSYNVFHDMLGKTMVSVMEDSSGAMVFRAEDGSTFCFYHERDCCESVSIEDISGELTDLVGSPILVAEEVSGEEPARTTEYTPDSETWTFYKYATAKGSVTVRWYGSSNGYYSESVSYRAELAPAPRSVEED